jgi:uncharacterized damage-inducible protein DinB
MRRSIGFLLTVILAGTLSAGAQTPAAPANPISQAIRDGWNGAKRNVAGSAKVMPAAKYSFKPTESVRTFGQILAHLAGANYIFCAAARGEKSPHAEDAFEKSATTPAAIAKALDDSIAYCDAAYSALDDRRAAEIIDGPFGGGKEARAAALMGNTGHNNEHYGNLVTYLRINGLTPPSSAPSR